MSCRGQKSKRASIDDWINNPRDSDRIKRYVKVSRWEDNLPNLADSCDPHTTGSNLPQDPQLPPLSSRVEANAWYPGLHRLMPRISIHLRIHVKNHQGLLQFVRTLNKAEMGTVDIFMHGRYFGDDGQLSHLVVTVASQNTTFLLDLVSLGKDANAVFIVHSRCTRHFRAILEDQSIKVCCFDARRDARALKSFCIRLQGVVDLKAFQDETLLPLTPAEMSESNKVLTSAKAVVAEHGTDVFAQKQLSSEALDPLHNFLVFDVTYMPRYYAARLRILRQLGEFDEQARTGRLNQILDKCKVHAGGDDEAPTYPQGEWNLLLGSDRYNETPAKACIVACPRLKVIITLETKSVHPSEL